MYIRNLWYTADHRSISLRHRMASFATLHVLLEMYHESIAGASVDAKCMLQRKLLGISYHVQAKGSGNRDTAEKQHIHIEMQQLQNQLQDMKSKIGLMDSEAKDSIQVLQRCLRPNKAFV